MFQCVVKYRERFRNKIESNGWLVGWSVYFELKFNDVK